MLKKNVFCIIARFVKQNCVGLVKTADCIRVIPCESTKKNMPIFLDFLPKKSKVF